jgi:hypothetical protein
MNDPFISRNTHINNFFVVSDFEVPQDGPFAQFAVTQLGSRVGMGKKSSGRSEKNRLPKTLMKQQRVE